MLLIFGDALNTCTLQCLLPPEKIEMNCQYHGSSTQILHSSTPKLHIDKSFSSFFLRHLPPKLSQKLRVLHKTFFTGKIARKFAGPK